MFSLDPKIAPTLANLPKEPGVYRFYGLSDDLLYIGKAKNLKNRVSSYFQESKFHSQRIALMVSQICKIEYTVVSSEEESLILEANLINNLQPKYNILLKNDHNYYYIRLSNDPIPGFFVVRQKLDPHSTYFGPYSNRFVAEETLKTLRSIFPFCQKKNVGVKLCQYVGIGQCDGICAGREDGLVYQQKIQQIKTILDGKIDQAEDFILKNIQQAVQTENFVLATLWRERLKLLKKTIQNNKLSLPTPQDIDLVSLVIDNNLSGLQMGSIFVQQIRSGRLINVNNFLLSGSELLEEEETDDLPQKFLTRFLRGYYIYQTNRIPVFVQVFEIAS